MRDANLSLCNLGIVINLLAFRLGRLRDNGNAIWRTMESKLYVGNLPYNTTDDDLRTLFEQAGAVKTASVIKDRETGRSKGFGFVEMETEADAEQAISRFNGVDFNGRPLKVNPARPPEPRQGGGGYNRSGSDSNRSSW